MSTTSRLISGSAASWVRIAINLVTQLALVPVYLTYWDVNTYGIWIATLTFVDIINTLDKGHQTYLGNEFLKLGDIKRENVRNLLWSGVLFGIILSLAQLIVIYLIIKMDFVPDVLGYSNHNQGFSKEVYPVLLLQSLNWMVGTSISGLFVRALGAFGYYPRMSWWGVLYGILIAVAPLVAVINGGGLLMASLSLTLSTLIYCTIQYRDLFALLKKEELSFQKPSIRLGFNTFHSSLSLSLKTLLENARQQGVRVLLAPLSGASSLVSFSTMRTGANVILQGLGTITNPLMPELMKFLRQRDQEKFEVALASVWMVLVFLLAPGVVILQIWVEPLYKVWTRGQIQFDPLLFALLSFGVLVYALAQPAIAIVVGNNLVRPQLKIASISATIVIAGLIFFVPRFGILGAGAALLIAEIVSAIYYRFVAKKWLTSNGLLWPNMLNNLSACCVLVSASASIVMIFFPKFVWLVLILSIPAFCYICLHYWRLLPTLAREKALSLLSKISSKKGSNNYK